MNSTSHAEGAEENVAGNGVELSDGLRGWKTSTLHPEVRGGVARVIRNVHVFWLIELCERSTGIRGRVAIPEAEHGGKGGICEVGSARRTIECGEVQKSVICVRGGGSIEGPVTVAVRVCSENQTWDKEKSELKPGK